MRFAPCPRSSSSAVVAFCTALVFSVLFSNENLWAQARTIKIVVPYPGGGLNETMLRIIVDYIRRRGDSPTFVIEARPGAATTLATEAVSRAAADGNTLLLVANSFLINTYLKKLSYEPLTSFEPICELWRSPYIFAVNSASPYHTLNDFLTAARQKPGDLAMAATGPGAGPHIGLEQLKRAANVEITFIPFNGAGPIVNALLGDHVPVGLADYGLVAEHLKSGKLRALATGELARLDALPDVPTAAESGLAGYNLDIWYGLVAPAHTSKDKIVQFTDWVTGALKDPAVREKIIDVGLYPVGACGADFATHLRDQNEKYGRIIPAANIKLE